MCLNDFTKYYEKKIHNKAYNVKQQSKTPEFIKLFKETTQCLEKQQVPTNFMKCLL